MKSSATKRIIDSIKEIWPKTVKTALWLVRITATVTLLVTLLEYFNLLPYISNALEPLFKVVGLPGSASLAFVTGYFVNVYSAVAVVATLQLDIRSITILGAMILCAHNMITESAVQKKAGSSAIRMVLVRTISAFLVAYTLNLIMPPSSEVVAVEESVVILSFLETLKIWAIKTAKLIALMLTIIFSLTILQQLLVEFGVIKKLSSYLKPLMSLFGLAPDSAFLWIVANTLGLAYGAAIMISEVEMDKISKREVDLLNHHISISHSNIEDLILVVSVGAIAWWLLIVRWFFSFLLVWGRRLELSLRKNC